jgi:hypothetical protein
MATESSGQRRLGRQRLRAVDREDWGGQGSHRVVEPRSVSEYLKILFESPRKLVMNPTQNTVAEKQSLFRNRNP